MTQKYKKQCNRCGGELNEHRMEMMQGPQGYRAYPVHVERCPIGRIDRVSFTGKPHLAHHKSEVSLCGKTAPFWYRTEWSGKSDGVCKICVKKLTEMAVQEQHEKAGA